MKLLIVLATLTHSYPQPLRQSDAGFLDCVPQVPRQFDAGFLDFL